MIYWLIGILVLFIIIAYIMSSGDYMAPPFLLALMMFLSVMAAWMMRNDWNLSIEASTCLLVVIGILAFYIGYYPIYNRMRKYNVKSRFKTPTYIHISNWKIFAYYIISVFFIYLFLKSVISNVGKGGTWMDIMARYRYATAYTSTSGVSLNIPEYIATGKFAINAATYIFIYVCVNNYICVKKWDIKLIFAIFIGLLSTLVGASRLDLIRIPIAFISIFYIIQYRSGRLTRSIRLKLLFQYMIVAVMVIVAFSSVRSFVGRKSTTGIIEYVCTYLGGPIALLNEYIKSPIHHTDIFGKESFWGIYHILSKITHNPKYMYDYTLEFRTVNGHSLGNVYTAFRMYYADFGIIGVIILDILLGCIFSFIYMAIKTNVRIKFAKLYSIVDFKIVIYSVIIHSIILMFYADWFFSQVIGWTQIKSIIFMWIIKIILIDIDKINYRNILERR